MGGRAFGGMVLAALFACLWGCSGGGNGSAGPAEELARNEALWAVQRPQAYRYVFRLSCFCTPETTQPARIEVRDGAPVSVTQVTPDLPFDPARYASFDTVEELFGVIRQALDAGAAQVRVTYDPDRGFPTEIFIDHIAPAVDDEIDYTVREFEPLG